MNGAASPPSTAPARPLLPDREWAKLLDLMAEKRLVPVVGPELLCVPHGAEPAARLYDLWGQALAEQRGIEVPPADGEAPLLYQVTNRLSIDPNMPIGELGYEINDVVSTRAWPLPLPLLQLAEITDFPLYLTTTIDPLLERALREARKTETPQVVSFKGSGSERDNDLPPGFRPGARPVIFHLFGRTCTDRDAFAATEDALIEFSWALIDHEYAPKNLYDFLHKKTLLLLGCNFPDWLDRFFIHALTRKRDWEIGVQYVSEYRMVGLYDFLRRKQAKPPVSQPPAAFVAELHRRWRQGRPRQPEKARGGKPGAVFISYAGEDLAAALAVRAQLEAAGIDTWMDESGLEPGAELQQAIRDNIDNASFFLALVSRSLDPESSGRLRRFVLREWKWAESAAEEWHKGDAFLQPVVIDDTPPGAAFVDRPFRDLRWTAFKDGALPPEFIERVRKGLRRFRSQQGGGGR